MPAFRAIEPVIGDDQAWTRETGQFGRIVPGPGIVEGVDAAHVANPGHPGGEKEEPKA